MPIAVPVRKLSVYLQPFRRSSFLECALQRKLPESITTPYFASSGWFEIIDVDTTEKLVTSACCDRQHASLSATVFTKNRPTMVKYNDCYRFTALWCHRVQVFLNLENRDLDCRNLRSMLNISYTGSFSMSISIDFGTVCTWNVSRSPKWPKNP